LFLLCWSALSHASGFQKGLLFRIEKSGVAPSYLFGTIHSEDPRVTRLPEPVRRAFNESGTFAMEVLLDAQAVMTSMAALVLTDGRDLPGIVGDDLFLASADAMAELGMPAPAVRQLKPWAVVTLLSTPPSHTGMFLDVLLYQRALEQNKKVFGLETVEEQLRVFDDMPEGDQKRLLAETLELRHELPVLHGELLDAYLRRDLQGLLRLSQQYMEGPNRDINHRFNAMAVDERNGLMVRRMRPLLEKGDLFVAVGALHLPGPRGILQRLRDEGFALEVVY
jgi:uncharacterized protein YbaP (TraB family)